MTQEQLETLKTLLDTDAPSVVVDQLQDSALCSSLCVTADDVATVDAEKAIELLRKQKNCLD